MYYGNCWRKSEDAWIIRSPFEFRESVTPLSPLL